MTQERPPLFNRDFSIRQAFSITNLVILVVGLLFTLVILGVVLKSRRQEINLRLANEAESARREIDSVFHEAQNTAHSLTEALPLLMNLDSTRFEFWCQRQFSTILTANPAQYDVYVALSKASARKLFKQDGYVYILSKNPDLIDNDAFNDSVTFQTSKFLNPSYQSDPQEIWYFGAAGQQTVYTTPLYFDRTYLKRVMFSTTHASRDPKTGALLGVVGVDLTSRSFARPLDELRIGKSGGVLLTTVTGSTMTPFLNHDIPMIGHVYDPALETRGEPLAVEPPVVLPRTSETHEFRGQDGKIYLLQARKLMERDFYVVAYQLKTEAYAILYWTLGSMLALAFIFLSVSLYFRQILAKFVTENIDKILVNISHNREHFASIEGSREIAMLRPEGPREVAKITHQLNLLYERLLAAFFEVRSERDRAELATRTKSRFLSVMSHEIRTPLNSMLGLTDVLLLSPLNSEQIRHLKVLQRSGQSLLHILNDILDFSRLEAGKLAIEENEFDLYELVYDVESLMRFHAESKGLQFRITAPAHHFRLIGDAIRIRQALLNLVGNAIKFTAHGNIEVRVTELQNTVDTSSDSRTRFQFEVADTGIGISKEHLGNIFSEFSQADASITRRYGGTGLGLSISRHLIELMRGEITIHSEEGKGSTLLFTLPLTVVSRQKAQYQETPTEHSARSIDPLLAKKTTNRVNPIPHTRVTESREEPNEFSFSDGQKNLPCILVVDDDEDNHSLIEAYLRFCPSIRATHVFSAKEALERLQNERFGLVLMDMQMPEMDGLEATIAIRALQKTGEISECPVVMLSANTFSEDREKSLEVGASEHIAKPIKLDAFKALLTRWIRAV